MTQKACAEGALALLTEGVIAQMRWNLLADLAVESNDRKPEEYGMRCLELIALSSQNAPKAK